MDKKDFIKWARKLEGDYVSNEEIRKDLAHIELIAIVGPTGVGKTTIVDALDIPYVKSDVTRDMRSDEKKNENYHFRSDYLEMMKEIKAGEYVQFTVSNSGEFYGTGRATYPNRGPCTMAAYAHVLPSLRKLGFKRVVPIYIMPPGYVEWMHRIGSLRSGDINTRISEAISSIKMAISDDEYHFVLNDNLELAVKDVEKIIADEQLDEHRTRLARASADVLLERLGDQDDDIYFSS